MNVLPILFITASVFLASVGFAQSVTDSNLRTREVVSGLDSPTTLDFIGVDDFLVLEKAAGRVRRVSSGTLQGEPVLDVAVDSANERGLLGIAVHPQFAINGYVYLFFTESSTGTDTNGTDPLGNRVYRYRWDGTNLVEGQLLLDLPATSPQHNGGVLAFGPDGKLYVATGDLNRSCGLQNVLGCDDLDDTSVILRLNDDGSTPDDNPFAGVTGAERYFAYGIRNCYGLAFDPASGDLWNTENGPNSYDEINRVFPGFNSGWNQIMGPVARSTGNTTNLVTLTGAQYADPKFSWVSPVAPTALAFVNTPALGANNENALLAADFINGDILRFDMQNNRTELALSGNLADTVADTPNELNSVTWGTGFGRITDLKFSPDGRLHVVDFAGGRVVAVEGEAPRRDLALVSVKVPKRLKLTERKLTQTKPVRVQIQNRGTSPVVIDGLESLENLVQFSVESLGACPAPTLELVMPRKGLPVSLAPKRKLTLRYNLTFDCINNPATGLDNADFNYAVSVNPDGDDAPANNTCPRDSAVGDRGCSALTTDLTGP